MRMAPIINLTEAERDALERLARGRRTAVRLALRAKIILAAAAGTLNRDIATALGINVKTVGQWRERYHALNLKGIEKDAPRPGRRPTFTTARVAAIIRKTTQETPANATQWSCRSMARATGMSEATVRRIWHRHGLKPHLVRGFKLSRDPHFEEKLVDIVGLYLNPPVNALVLSADEKSQIQALDRTQPGLPMTKGRLTTQTHDYKRHGTTTLFAALNILDGKVISRCAPRHRHQEWLTFLKQIDAETPPGIELHLIVDNYSTHKHRKVKAWAARHPRFHFHFTPTSASWLNMVERFFRDLSVNMLRRGVFKSVDMLIARIEEHLHRYNAAPKPFIWTAKASDILEKVMRARAAQNKSASA